MVFLGVQNDREWAVLCTSVLDRPELVDDPRYARNTGRIQHEAELKAIVEDRLASLSADEVLADLEAKGIACARMRTPQEFFEHPQLAARDRWREVGTTAGPVSALLPPVVMVGEPARMGDVPALGQHTAALRREFAVGAAE